MTKKKDDKKEEFLLLRIDDSYSKGPFNKKIDSLVKKKASEGWQMNLDYHPNVKFGYVIYRSEIIRKFEILGHTQDHKIPEHGKNKMTYEKLDIKFIDDPKDTWIHRLIKYDKNTYQNPVRYADYKILRKYEIDLMNYYRKINREITMLEEYYNSHKEVRPNPVIKK